MFQYGTSPVSGSYREILTRLVACATSQHVSAAVLNAAGTGYAVGDILTISHAGAYAPLLIEVLTTSSGPPGPVATFALRAGGAFSNRVATVAVNAGGTGYPVSTTIFLEVQGGTFTEKAKVSATTNGSGVVTAVTLIETGGAYTVAPAGTGAATAIVGPSTATTGSGCTVNTTMTTLIGTTAIGHTGGTGTGATFDLTLTATGWSALSNRRSYSVNSINDEKEIVLQGTVSGGKAPLVGIRSYTQTSGINTRWGWLLAGMDSYNAGNPFGSQLNIGPDPDPTTNLGVCLYMFDNAQSYWFAINPRRIVPIIKAVGLSITSYCSGYAGLLDPFGTQVEAPYPMFIAGTSYAANRPPDSGGFFVTGLTEYFTDINRGSARYRRQSDGAWVSIINLRGDIGLASGTEVAHPIGAAGMQASNGEDQLADYGRFNTQLVLSGGNGAGVSVISGGAATQAIMPTLGTNEIVLFPVVLLTGVVGPNTSETLIRGELAGVFWHGGTKSDGNSVAAEDTFTQGTKRYIVFQNVHRTERYSFFALAAE